MGDRSQYSFAEFFIRASSRSQLWTAIVRGIGAASSFLVLSALSVHEFGRYQLVLAAVAMAASFAAGLFDDIVVNEISRALVEGARSRAKRLFQEFFVLKALLAMAISLGLFAAAGLVAAYYGQDIAVLVRLASVLVVVDIFRVLEIYFFRATRSLAAFGAEALQEAARLVFLAGLWFFGRLGLGEILVALIAASLVAVLYVTFRFVRHYRRTFRDTASERGWLLPALVRTYGRWVFLRYGAARLFKGTDVWFIRLFLSTEAVAYYSVAVSLITFAHSLFPTAILGLLLPWELTDRRRFAYIYQRMVKYGAWLGLGASLGAWFIVPGLIELIFPKYVPAMGIFRVMALTLPLYAVYKFQKSFLTVLREQKVLTMRLVSEQVLTLGILAALLPLIGLYAAVISYLVTYGGRVILFTVYLRRSYPELRVKWKHLVSFDETDRTLLDRVWSESMHPGRWWKSIRISPISPP